jgi:hypothetical protein
MRPSVWAQWQALHLIDPWDESRADRRAGEVAAAVMNAQGAKKQGGDGFAPADFMAYIELQADPSELERRQTQQLHAFLMAHGKGKR